MKKYIKFCCFYFLSMVTNICFLVLASKLADVSEGRFVLMMYSCSVFSIMVFGYLGLKGLIDDNGQ